MSLWATSPREFEQNCSGTPRRVFTRIIGGLHTLSDLKEIEGAPVPKILIFYVINRNSYHSINSAVDLALNTRCDELNFSVMQSGLKVDHGIDGN